MATALKARTICAVVRPRMRVDATISDSGSIVPGLQVLDEIGILGAFGSL